MQDINAQELSLSTITPRELWEKSGRWEQAGAELLTLKDRRGGEFCLAPTHEEAITCLVRDHLQSPKQLPARLYQMDRKYRDEPRPRSGLLRSREFWMKDLYTFDVDEAGALETYQAVTQAYHGILRELSVPYVQVEADTGMIGGSLSHEFHLLTDMGEDTISLCHTCQQGANDEVTEGKEYCNTPMA